MSLNNSISKRRLFVLLNYLSIITALLCFGLGQYINWNTLLFIGLGVSIVVMLVSFFILHINTGLWKLVHTKTDDLDERQLQVTHQSLRNSYSIFTIVSLLIILGIVFIAKDYSSMFIIIFASLIYLAHTLPSSILAWREKEV